MSYLVLSLMDAIDGIMLISHVLSWPWERDRARGGQSRPPRMPREYIIITLCRIIPTANTPSINGTTCSRTLPIRGYCNIIFFRSSVFFFRFSTCRRVVYRTKNKKCTCLFTYRVKRFFELSC